MADANTTNTVVISTLDSLQNPNWTYSLTIKNLKVKQEGNNANSVVQTYWDYTGTDTANNTGSFSGATPFSSLNMPAGDVFIPFEQLTEADVVKWIKDVVVGNYAEHVHEKINEQIDQKINIVSELALPWAPAANTANTAV